MNYCSFNIGPYYTDMCVYLWCPQTLAEICRNMCICCGFRTVADREKISGVDLIRVRYCLWHFGRKCFWKSIKGMHYIQAVKHIYWGFGCHEHVSRMCINNFTTGTRGMYRINYLSLPKPVSGTEVSRYDTLMWNAGKRTNTFYATGRNYRRE